MPPTGIGQRAEIGPEAVRELDERDGEHSDAGILEALEQVRLVGPALHRRPCQLNPHTALAQHQPWIHVGRELPIRDEHGLPRGDWEGRSCSIEPDARIRRQRDFLDVGIDETRHRRTRIGEHLL
jgi:hypothetical protein